MRPDDEDGENEGGPPPDPSLRQWRHPSEIAAASAAAARAEQSAPLRRRGPLVATVAITAAASIAVGFGALIFAVVIDSDDPETSFSLQQQGGSQGAEPANSEPSTSAPGPREVSSTALAARTDSTPTTIGPASNTPDGRQPTSTLITTMAPDSPGQQGPTDRAGNENGLFTTSGAGAERLAAFLVVDDTVFTSASAISGFDEVAVLVDGQWTTATVTARDPINDLAVLDIADEAEKAHILAAHHSVWSSLEEPDTVSKGERIMLVVDGEEPVDGFVIDDDDRVVAHTGSSIYGVVRTSAPKPSGSSGAALTDESGGLVGLVVDSAGYMASVIPFETILDIGRSVREWGVPAVEWLGIKGSSLPTGGVRLDEVLNGGPAFAAEMHRGDVIARVDGVSVLDWEHLVHLVRQSGAGSTIRMLIERDSSWRQVEATVGIKPAEGLASPSPVEATE